MARKLDIHIQEAHRVTNNINPKRSTARHIIIKMANVKDHKRSLKASRKKQLVTYNEAPMRLSVVFFSRNFGDTEGLAHTIQSDKNTRTYNQDYSTQ